ncbi:Putative glutamate--cysteine ligase 2 [Streptomyces xanthophaeus]|uniref:carboxylate-amine ligase n=1 Tax=Streptomyces xanthophaeus TaxID=67385 RepID=UPI00386A6231|nr:Putative glutamate--cysteine ligase 2 [Streptomyces xanthophaeus]
MCTRPTATPAALSSELALLRRVMAEVAADEGCLLVATGTPAVPPGRPLTVTPGERYGRMAARWSSLVGGYDGMVCGCHVHVGVTGHAQALAPANHVRPWLPTLQAIAANSLFSRGRDTGWAGHRSVEWARWPGVGPAPLLDEAGHERLAGHLVRTGTLLDRRMIYWHARPSEHVPTPEIRVCDVNADLDVVVLLTALVRGLATSLLPDIRNGRPSHALAAQRGLIGEGFDPARGAHVPAVVLAERLLNLAAPGLAATGALAGGPGGARAVVTAHRTFTARTASGNSAPLTPGPTVTGQASQAVGISGAIPLWRNDFGVPRLDRMLKMITRRDGFPGQRRGERPRGRCEDAVRQGAASPRQLPVLPGALHVSAVLP